uniref:Uncharacterized protein n=1 Tax=Geobacter metallireducens TaxID=28232 RepID=A0A831UCY2_GEOME
MKRLFGRNKAAGEPEEKITDAMLGTGEAMCTCAALVADMIVDAGQEGASVSALLEKVKSGEAVPPKAEDPGPRECP